MTLVAARDLSPLGIRVVTIAPGMFLTPAYPMPAEQLEAHWGPQIPFPKRMGQPAEYAGLVAEHRRQRLPQRRSHPPGRSASVRPEVTRALAGKVAFVAGASRGIGATIAAALAREGAAVAVAARTEAEGQMPGTDPLGRGPDRRGGRPCACRCSAMSPTRIPSTLLSTRRSPSSAASTS